MAPQLMYSAKNCGLVSSGRAVPSMTVIYNGMKAATTAVHVVVSILAHIHSKGCVMTRELIVRPPTTKNTTIYLWKRQK